MAPVVPDPRRIKTFESEAAFEKWLAAHHATWPEVWIKMHKAATLPADLRAAIEANPRARKTFRTLYRQNLFALAFRTDAMTTSAGRAKKIAALVAMLARGETILPNSPPNGPARRRRPGRAR